jgi:hypothetical protein
MINKENIMADTAQANAASLEDWDEVVRQLLSANELKGQDQMQAAYFDVIDRSGFSSEVQSILRAMDVTVVRQESDGPAGAEAGAASEDSAGPFWEEAKQATTQSLQAFLMSLNVPDDVAALYSAAGIGIHFQGNSQHCLAKCSGGDFRRCCC